MNKSALKRFATSMRLELISLVKTKIDFLLSDAYKENLALYDTNKKSISQIAERYAKDKEDFIEEIAYTWFNRLVALRFMDANEITSAPIISTTAEQPIPQAFINAKSGTIEDDLNINKELFFDLIDKKVAGVKDSDNEAYKMLFISTCNHYAKLMPTMFERISDYTELLLPEDMLSPNSLRAQVVTSMDAEDCKDIEVIGWLYQFYISDKKDDVFAQLKKNKKITPANIPASTQLFTPHWIVKYMVENSLGKIWMLNHPNSSLKESMKYYIDNTEESSTFIKVNTPQELTFLDPCCGSGHTLTYAFDLLTLIYEEEGYNKSDIPSLILEHNLFGCDIDKRASVLANFALTMKARQYYKRFFNKDVKPNIVELEDYGSVEFAGIKNFGSLMVPHAKSSFDDGIFSQNTREYELQKKILSSEFHCVVTNPPYMGGKGMNAELGDFVKKQYPDSKSDLFAVFLERGFEMIKANGYMAMITMQSWMFLSSYEKLREKLLKNYTITTMIHLDNMVMGIAFGTVATVFQKSKPTLDSKAVYFKINLDDLDENREIVELK
jgi:SAM-dependent methyltransferase